MFYLGIKESDTGLAPPALWDLAADKQTLQSEQPLQVARWVHSFFSFGVELHNVKNVIYNLGRLFFFFFLKKLHILCILRILLIITSKSKCVMLDGVLHISHLHLLL